MKRIFVAIFLFPLVVHSAQSPSSHESCLQTLAAQPKQAHKIAACIEAAAAGYPDVLYAVGMAYGYSGAASEEMRYYQASANKGFPPAFLAMGHVMRSAPYNNSAEAIKWYERYVQSRYEGWGYAAALISQLHQEQGTSQKATEWAAVCKQSSYEGCPK